MRRNLKVQVIKGGITSGDVVIKTVDANDENVKKLFGDLHRMTIIISGGTIDKVIITEEKEGDGMEKNHAILSASSSHRWLECTPSARLELEFEDYELEAAKEGTAAYALAEHKLKRKLKMRSESLFVCLTHI